MKLYQIKQLEWTDGDYMSFSSHANYTIEFFEGRYFCAVGGADITIMHTLQGAKLACKEHYEAQLKQHLQEVVSVGDVANQH